MGSVVGCLGRRYSKESRGDSKNTRGCVEIMWKWHIHHFIKGTLKHPVIFVSMESLEPVSHAYSWLYLLLQFYNKLDIKISQMRRRCGMSSDRVLNMELVCPLPVKSRCATPGTALSFLPRKFIQRHSGVFLFYSLSRHDWTQFPVTSPVQVHSCSSWHGLLPPRGCISLNLAYLFSHHITWEIARV